MYVSACWCSHACLYFQTRQQHVSDSIIQSSRPLSHVMTAGRVVAAAEAAGAPENCAFWGERCPLQQHWAWTRCSPHTSLRRMPGFARPGKRSAANCCATSGSAICHHPPRAGGARAARRFCGTCALAKKGSAPDRSECASHPSPPAPAEHATRPLCGPWLLAQVDWAAKAAQAAQAAQAAVWAAGAAQATAAGAAQAAYWPRRPPGLCPRRTHRRPPAHTRHGPYRNASRLR